MKWVDAETPVRYPAIRDMRMAWQVIDTAGKGRQQRVLKRSDLPWPSEF